LRDVIDRLLHCWTLKDRTSTVPEPHTLRADPSRTCYNRRPSPSDKVKTPRTEPEWIRIRQTPTTGSGCGSLSLRDFGYVDCELLHSVKGVLNQDVRF
jgi:hypothetical protein